VNAEDPPPSSVSPPSTVGGAVLGMLSVLAVLGLLAMLLGRTLGPSLAGVYVGADAIVQAVGTAGDVASQTFAFFAMLTAIVAVLAVARSGLPIAVRFSAVSLGGVGVLTTLWALHEPVPTPSACLVSGCASLVALLAAVSALRTPGARGAAAVVGLVALGAFVRLAGVALVLETEPARGSRIAAVAGGCATASFVVDALAAVTALGWVARAARIAARRGPRLVSPWVLGPLVLAMFGARWALLGRSAEAPPVALLLWRCALHLLTLPDPSLSTELRVFLAFLGPLTAAAALLARGPAPAFGAAVALALLARGSVEMPPCALMLMIGALGLGLAAHRHELYGGVGSG
jgi:hypothetical protein